MAQRTILRCLSDSAANVVSERSDRLSPSPVEPPPPPPPALSPEAFIGHPIREEGRDLLESKTLHDTATLAKPWWAAAQRIAVLVINEGMHIDNEHAFRRELVDQGFHTEAIDRALEWLGSVMLSGQTSASLAMLVPIDSTVRIEHPLEQLSIPVALRQALLICIRKGLMTRDFSEKILEGFRNIEARDWGRKEVAIFLFDALSPALPWLTHPILENILNGGKNQEMFH